MMERNSDCWYREVCDESNSCNACIRFIEMQFLMESSNLPKARQRPQILTAPDCDFDAYTKLANIKDNIVDFVNNGKNLYIASEVTGNGKTSWAIKLMLKYFDNIWAGNGFNVRALFVSVPTFLLKCKDFDNKDEAFELLKKQLPNVDLVIWDDIASTSMSAYDYSQLLMYIDMRTLECKSNIYTGNYPNYNELQDRLGVKLASRIFANNTDVIVFKGGDRR